MEKNNFIFTFKEVTKEKFINLSKERFVNTKFFYKSLNDEVKYIRENESGDIFISFFNEVYFHIRKDNLEVINEDSKKSLLYLNERYSDLKDLNKKIKSMKFDFYSFYISEKEFSLDNKECSYLLRGSSTLTIDKTNCYDNTDIKAIFGEYGFLLINKFYTRKEVTNKSQREKFEKISILYLLAHAYNIYSEKLMTDVSLSYKRNNSSRMIELRKEIYVFDLNCFFSNPVDYKRHQLYSIWGYLESIYSVEKSHREMKSQVEDLVNLIELKNKEEEKRRIEEEKLEQEKRYREIKELREKQRLEDEKRYREREEERENEKKYERKKYRDLQIEKEKENKKASRRTTILTILGIVIAAFSLGSVYADLVELGALNNIFE